MNRNALLIATTCTLAAVPALAGQAASVDRVVRYGDGRGLIVRYVEDLKIRTDSISLAEFKLVDFSSGQPLQLADWSTFSRKACSYPRLSPRIESAFLYVPICHLWIQAVVTPC
jgi:hypothetical protein